MIHYQLRCAAGHEFEGWFRDSAGFEEQARRKLLSCPQCGVAKVDRALMAPSVQSAGKRAKEPALQAPVDAPAAAVMLPDQLRAVLQRLRAEVERHCDDVGDGFAEAARRLHRAAPAPDQQQRGIYGRLTESEREALSEEGIETAQIPWLPRAEG